MSNSTIYHDLEGEKLMEKQYCLVCHSFDIQLIEPTSALDGRPEFKCGSCGHSFYYGKTGEPYYSYCINRKKS